MTWVNYEIFTDKWLKRAEREKASIDDVDRFISLWIAFNGWMKGKYGENTRECYMIKKVKELRDMESVFTDLKEHNSCFAKDLNKLEQYTVANMRHINDESKNKRYDGTFESLIETIYQIRCNLFHGRKDAEDKKDTELARLSYRILIPLFKEYLKTYGFR